MTTKFSHCFKFQRHFAYENPYLLDRAEDEDESLTSLSAEDAEDPSIREPLKKKYKRGQGRHTTKGEDFWSKVEMWFEARQKQWGDSWGTPGWTAYVCLTVWLHIKLT
ncbi:hypothetical protein BDR06DRAFT_1008651 [Suillus hirtellus]|nr:hypothetical protein BDR06DRAFT_1008651 [Suillus hirtellus]